MRWFCFAMIVGCGGVSVAEDEHAQIEINIDKRTEAEKATATDCATVHCMGSPTLFHCRSTKPGWCEVLLPYCVGLYSCDDATREPIESVHFCCW